MTKISRADLKERVLDYISSECTTAGKPVALTLWKIAQNTIDWGRGRPSFSAKRSACTKVWMVVQSLVSDGKLLVNSGVKPCVYSVPIPSISVKAGKTALAQIDIKIGLRNKLLAFARELEELAASMK